MQRCFFLAFYTCVIFYHPLHSQYDSLGMPPKVRHTEPVYADLVRDLGARRGEREFNIGWGMVAYKEYEIQSGFVEYEFCPVNRLGLEVEIPFYFVRSSPGGEAGIVPRNRIEGLKLASQYTFLVNPRFHVSMAGGYIHEIKTHSFITIRQQHRLLKGNRYSPFLVMAKRWGRSIHSQIYTGTSFERSPTHRENTFLFHLTLHYAMPGSRSFIGVEINRETTGGQHQTIIRPQAKLPLSSALSLGMAVGIPIAPAVVKMDFLFRLVYEPGRN